MEEVIYTLNLLGHFEAIFADLFNLPPPLQKNRPSGPKSHLGGR